MVSLFWGSHHNMVCPFLLPSFSVKNFCYLPIQKVGEKERGASLMQIQNTTSVTPNITTNLSQPNVGDVLQVTVKERVNDQDAIVSMKGTARTVTFEGSVPEQDKVSVEITGKTTEGNYTVKVSDKSSAAPSAPQNADSQVSEAVKAFTSNGMSLTKEDLASIKDFLTNGKGTIDQKMDTLRMMAQKQIAISKNTLKSVHEALNGKPLASSLISVLDELGISYPTKSVKSLETVRAEVQHEPNAAEAVRLVEDFLKNTNLSDADKRALEKSISEAKKFIQAGQSVNAKVQLIQNLVAIQQQNTESIKSTTNLATNLSMDAMQNSKDKGPQEPSLANVIEKNFADSVQRLVKDVQKEPSFAKVLEKIADLLTKQGFDEKMEPLKQAHEKAQQLQEKGRELAARREISNALSQMEKNVSSQPNTQENTLSQAEQYAINEAIQSLKLDSQNVMVTEITKKLSQMAIDFKQTRQEVSKNLDNVSKMLENRNILPQANTKQILQSTIHKLDHAILKGDYLLYTDMATEKTLLSASSQLAKAKKLLAKGEYAEANTLVKEVKTNIDNIMFKPSDIKVKHYVSDKLGLEGFSSPKLSSTLEQVIQPFSSHESSSRQLYEAIRKLGLTHETDSAFSLVSKSGTSIDPQQNDNVKATLLKMMKNEDMKPQMVQQVEQAVNSITGQQLLNKQDSSSTQNLFFQLPYLMDQQVENIKIYVNSRKDGDKMDWENCSLYFVLETKKLGDIGVHLSSSEKNVSLTFKSNKDRLDEKVADLTEITKERFKEIGYNLNAMGVKPLHEQSEKMSTNAVEKHEPELTPTFTEKGYDFSI